MLRSASDEKPVSVTPCVRVCAARFLGLRLPHEGEERASPSGRLPFLGVCAEKLWLFCSVGSP